MRLPTGKVVADRYEIEAILGSGGMSVVYCAYDKKLDRNVTLKVLKEDYLTDDDLADRFPQEARAAAALNHQNIVSIFDFGQDGEICYIVLEYVDGTNLKERVTKKAPFDSDIVLAVTIQIAEGLAEAHRNGIVHRDVKPQNILVTKTNIVKVADFGIARVARSSTLTAGGSMGSVHYSSPEQARNGYLDHTTDIYSLGVCMYEMATGTLPFDGEREISIAMCHLNNEFPDILERNPNVSESIVKIIKKATEKASALRYQSCEDLIADLKRAFVDSTGSFVTSEVDNPSQTRVIGADTGKIAREAARASFLEGIEHSVDDDEQSEYAEFDEYEEYDDDYEEKKKSSKVPIFGGIVAGLILIIPLIILVFAIYNRLSRGGDSDYVVPPNVVNMPLEAARERAGESGLYVYPTDFEYHNTISYGYIIRQIQRPGYRGLTEGGTILVVVSLGPQEEEYASTEPDSQDELYNDENDNENELDESQVAVPILIGQTEVAALDRLREAMLIPGTRTQQESTTYPAGTVMGQTPTPGSVVNRETVVNYVVSTGPPEATPAEPPPEPPPTVEEPTPPAEDPDPPAEDPAPPPVVEEPEPPAEEDPAPPIEDPEPPAQEDPPPPADEPTESRRTLNIALWPVADDTETVHIRITRQEGNEPPVAIADDSSVTLDRFPIAFNVYGTGSVVFRMYSVENGVEIPRGDQIINFDE